MPMSAIGVRRLITAHTHKSHSLHISEWQLSHEKRTLVLASQPELSAKRHSIYTFCNNSTNKSSIFGGRTIHFLQNRTLLLLTSQHLKGRPIYLNNACRVFNDCMMSARFQTVRPIQLRVPVEL